MNILVCGSRKFKDRKLMEEVFQSIPIVSLDTLIHGDAKGADKLSELCVPSHVPIRRFPANWKKYGRAAGPIRNKQMLEEGKPDLVIAFLGKRSRGTKDMIKQARKAGIPVQVIDI